MSSNILEDMYTGPDGRGYSIGRVYSFPVLTLGLAYPTVALIKNHPWNGLELAAYLAGLGAAVWIFIKGHNNIDTPEGPVPQRTRPLPPPTQE